MKVRVLYLVGCPNHGPTVELAKQVIADLGVNASVEEVEIRGAADAERLRFLGSPTVVVNGEDIEPGARSRTGFGFCCRTYNGQGAPPRKLLEDALKGRGPGSGKTELWAALGSVVSAVVASACCWLPLLALAFGLSAAGASATFEAVRPISLIAMAGLLGGGFYLSYFRRSSCATGEACAAPYPRFRRINRAVLWVAAVFAFAVTLFPSYAGILIGGTGTAGTVHRLSPAILSLTVEGMTCEGCSALVRKAFKDVRGVVSVKVDHDGKQVVISTESCCPAPVEAVLQALEKAGYRGEVIENSPPRWGQ
jgi:mercuric ion transport protein